MARTLPQARDEFIVAMNRDTAGTDRPRLLAVLDALIAWSVARPNLVRFRPEDSTKGVLTFERGAGPPFDAAEQRLATAAGTLLGPVWAPLREAERGAIGRLGERSRSLPTALFGPRHPGLKLIGASAVALLTAMAASKRRTRAV